jgi:hypothetical protein
MNLREVYEQSILQNFESLSLLIEYLVLEKKVLDWESDKKELDRYLAPRNYERMTKLLLEYQNKWEVVV